MMKRRGRVGGLFLLIMAWAVLPAQGQPPPSGPVKVTGVTVEPLGPASATLVITSDGPLAYPESFSLPDPPRLVIDLPHTLHAIPAPIPLAKGGPVVQVRSSQYREQPVGIVRLVVDLQKPLPYRLEVVEGQVKVLIGEAAGPPEERPALAKAPTAEPPRPSQVLEETPEAGKPPLPPEGQVTSIDFQPLKDRARVVIGTRGKVSYRVSELANPPRVVVDLSGASLLPEVPKSLDVRKRSAVVARIRSAQYRKEPERVVRVVAELKQRTSYTITQTPEAITLDLQARETAALAEAPPTPPPTPSPEVEEIAPPVPPPGPPTAVAPPGPGRLSLDFKDADIGNILRILSEVGGVNIVAGEEVKGKVTVRLTNVDWRQALDVILKVNKLDALQRDNIIWVASEATIQKERAAKEEAELRAREKKVREVQLEPTVTKIVPVNYAKAADLQKRLERLKTPGRTDVGIDVDERTNSLIITDVPAAIERMVAYVKEQDTPTPQVLIEARIVEATRTFAQSLGITWGGAVKGAPLFGSTSIGTIFGTVAGAPIQVPGAGTGTAIEAAAAPAVAQPGATLPIGFNPLGPVPLFVNFPALGTAPAALGFILGEVKNRFVLGAQLSAAESEGTVKTLSAPKVATLDNQEAEIRQGTQVPFTTIDSSGRTVVAFQDAFIRLKVTPHITADRRISMRVEAERSFPGTRIDFAGGFAFPINTRKATTNVLVPNGGTIVIAGLLQTTESEAEDRVPFLWRIPVLGYLFKRHNIGPNERIELLIFLTPTILEEARLS